LAEISHPKDRNMTTTTTSNMSRDFRALRRETIGELDAEKETAVAEAGESGGAKRKADAGDFNDACMEHLSTREPGGGKITPAVVPQQRNVKAKIKVDLAGTGPGKAVWVQAQLKRTKTGKGLQEIWRDLQGTLEPVPAANPVRPRE
jgi:hypothetical protein